MTRHRLAESVRNAQTQKCKKYFHGQIFLKCDISGQTNHMESERFWPCLLYLLHWYLINGVLLRVVTARPAQTDY